MYVRNGARPEEFLRLTNLDMKVDSKGAVLILRGKTGERRVRIISFVKLLEQWLQVHALRSKISFMDKRGNKLQKPTIRT
jgi:hypothetical protein